LTRSYDRGDSWTDPVTVSVNTHGSFPGVDSQGNVFVVYGNVFTLAGGVSRSIDGGDTFERVGDNFQIATAPVPFMDRSPPLPQLAIDNSAGPRNGWVYVVWHQLSPEGVLRPYITHSEDRGDTWSPPLAINSDCTQAFHWWPSVSVDDNGNVNVIF